MSLIGVFLGVLVFVFIIKPLFRLLWAFYKMRRNMRNFMRGNSYQGASQPREEKRERRGGWSPKPTQRKKIDPEVGEYVDFEEEELATQRTVTTAPFTREEQVADAEWEEIK